MQYFKRIFYLCGIALFFCSAKCHQGEYIYEKTPSFKISKAYEQLLVSGQKDGISKIEIGFILEDLEKEINIDSIYYQQLKALPLSKNGSFFKTSILSTESKKIDNFEGFSLDGKIVLFYSKQNKIFFTLQEKINKKQPLYLP